MNMLEIHLQTIKTLKAENTEPDRRYRIMVSLIRSDRPKYWNFRCMSCGSKVCEIVNCDVYDLADFYDPQNVTNSGVLRHCKGVVGDGLPCQYSYFFNMV